MDAVPDMAIFSIRLKVTPNMVLNPVGWRFTGCCHLFPPTRKTLALSLSEMPSKPVPDIVQYLLVIGIVVEFVVHTRIQPESLVLNGHGVEEVTGP